MGYNLLCQAAYTGLTAALGCLTIAKASSSYRLILLLLRARATWAARAELQSRVVIPPSFVAPFRLMD